MYVYCTFVPTRHPALTPSPCQLQLDCCSQSRIDQKLLRAADKNSIRRGKKSSEIAVQQSSLKCQVEQPQTPYHTHLRTHVKVQRFRAQLRQGRHGTETQRPRTSKQKRDSQAGVSKVLRGGSVSAKVQTGVHNFRLRKLKAQCQAPDRCRRIGRWWYGQKRRDCERTWPVDKRGGVLARRNQSLNEEFGAEKQQLQRELA